MTYAYSEKTLGAGSIGGQGFWLTKEARAYFSGFTGLWGNSNLRKIRALVNALVFNDELPFIENQSLLEFLYEAYNWHGYYGFGAGATWTTCATFGAKNLYGLAPWSSVARLPRYQEQRHVHRVLSDNLQGSFIESAVRIPLGESGYTDILPGLFQIEPVAGTIVSGDYCYVVVKPYSNPRVWWINGDSRVHYDFQADFGSIFHPYLRSASEMVRVDLSTGNSNKHLIPGVDIRLNTPLDGDKSVLSIGYEYVNAYSESGDMGEITGAKDYYMPLSARGLQPYGAENEFYTESNAYPTSVGWDSIGFGSNAPSRWHIYNVTGEAQEGCEFSIRPLVRLDQGNRLHPFDQWFMGCNVDTSLTPQSTPFTVSFTNYVDGFPATVRLVITGASISTDIVEINSTTFQPTGVTHIDGVGLKCDGSTLYRWDAAGVYFVLSNDLVAADTANIYIRLGNTVEHYFQMTTTETNWDNPNFTEPPFSVSVGGWNAIYNSGSGLYYPVSYAMPETNRTGIIQTQGHDYEFFNSGVDSANSHWYNHQECVATFLRGFDWAPHDNMNEYAVMITCDDPRYFQVVPCTWNYCGNKLAGAYEQLEEMGEINASRCSANISVRDADYTIKCGGNIHERQGGLVLRVNQISQEIVDLMGDSGITLE